MLYFAYGSNLDRETLEKRCPNFQPLFTGMVEDFKLAFTHKSKKTQSGTADMVPSQGNCVYGIVCDIPLIDTYGLFQAEGYQPAREVSKNAYAPQYVTVHYQMNGANVKCVAEAFTVVEKSHIHIPPKREYLNKIIVACRAFGFPEDYIRKLTLIRSVA